MSLVEYSAVKEDLIIEGSSSITPIELTPEIKEFIKQRVIEILKEI